MNDRNQPTVLLTDYAWPDIDIERAIIEGAGFNLVAGPSSPATPEAIEALAREHQPQAILTCWAQVSAAAIASDENLKIVTRLGIGLDNIAVDEATRRGVWVTNVPTYCLEEVSDHVVGMILAWARGLVHFDREVKAGRWQPAAARLRRVSTLTCGIIGYGRIGRYTAKKLRDGFGVRVLANTPRPPSNAAGVEFVALDELLANADVVVIHAPLTADTHHLINSARIAKMRPGAMLINVSRGGVVDTDAVVAALASGHLSAAGLDVLETEPVVPPALAASPSAILTPHVAFSSETSLIELRRSACEEVVRVLRGEAPHEARNVPGKTSV